MKTAIATLWHKPKSKDVTWGRIKKTDDNKKQASAATPPGKERETQTAPSQKAHTTQQNIKQLTISRQFEPHFFLLNNKNAQSLTATPNQHTQFRKIRRKFTL